ncbi:MAG: hypothetical protein WBM00_03930 [Solirubrobacterales bacterium]
MRKSIITAAILAALVALAAIAPSIAPASKSVSFSGSYKGTFSATKSGSKVSISSVKAKGTGSLGLNSLSGGPGSGKTTSASCGSFGGPGVISGAGGSIKLAVSSSSLACAAGGDNLTFKGSAKVSGGTGKYGKASGTLTFKGTANKKSGAFSVKISGKLDL